MPPVFPFSLKFKPKFLFCVNRKSNLSWQIVDMLDALVSRDFDVLDNIFPRWSLIQEGINTYQMPAHISDIRSIRDFYMHCLVFLP